MRTLLTSVLLLCEIGPRLPGATADIEIVGKNQPILRKVHKTLSTSNMCHQCLEIHFNWTQRIARFKVFKTVSIAEGFQYYKFAYLVFRQNITATAKIDRQRIV